jgi:hypothetical protein
MAVRKDISGAIMMEIILMIGVLLAVFPILQRNIKNRSESLRNEYVIKDMMRLKSALENFLERRIYTLDFYENPVIEISGKDLEVFYETGLPKGFKGRNILGQDYTVKIRRYEPAPGQPFEYDAIVIAGGNPAVTDVRIKEIAKESKGYGGYLEDGIIYGQSWSYDAGVWKGKTGVSPDSLVFKTGFLKRDYQYISRVNERYARMNTNLDMNLNNIYGVGRMKVAGDAEVNKFRLDSGAKASTDTMTVLANAMFRGQIEAHIVRFINGIDKSTLNIDGGTKTKEIYLESRLGVTGVLKTLVPETENTLNYVKAGGVRGLDGALTIYVANLLTVPVEMPFRSSRMAFGTLSVDARSMREGADSTDAVGILFRRMMSAKDDKYRVDDSQFAGFDVIVKELNRKLSLMGAGKIGGIDITDQTPLSVIMRGLSYEYADIFRLVHNRYPNASETPIPGWSLGPLHRCLEEYCDPGKYPFWDAGIGN